MIEFNPKRFSKDFEVPLNPMSVLSAKTNNECVAEYLSMFSESYFHAGDILFDQYYDFLAHHHREPVASVYDANMWGVIYRLYCHSFELKLKSLLYAKNYTPKNEHSIEKLVCRTKEMYDISNDSKIGKCLEYIKTNFRYSYGSQAGRYPISSKGEIIGWDKKEGGYIVTVGIVKMVLSLHECFKELCAFTRQ